MPRPALISSQKFIETIEELKESLAEIHFPSLG
jgi:hypothetical protein